MNETELIQAVNRGDTVAFEQLFIRYYTRLVVFACRFVPDEDTARELVQDVFVSFFDKQQTIEIHTSLKAHLYQSVRNRCLNHIKREKNIKLHHDNIYHNNINSDYYLESSIEQTEFENKIFQLIQSLPDKCRQVFEMSRFEGLKNDDIAQKLDISKRTVETQISKALKFLRDNLKEAILLFITWFISALSL
jgi:RNA polymerase sigma-70 factor (family 1)